MKHVHADRATGLAMLHPSDPEAAEARRHAATCAECAARLSEGEALARVLSEAKASEPPPRAVLDATLSRVFADMDRGAPATTRAFKYGPLLAALLIWGMLVGMARFRRTEDLAWLESIAALVVAGVCARVATAGGSFFVLASVAASRFISRCA